MVDRRSIPSQVRRRAAPTADQPRGLPHVYRGGSRSGRKTNFESEYGFGERGGRFRWLLSTCLAGGVGAVAILVVLYGSTDRSEYGGLSSALRKMREGTPEAAMVLRHEDGLRWAVPKSDKLQITSGAVTTRYIIHDSLKVRKANREYIHAKPYARIVAHLAPVGSEYADVIPPFNPFKLYATERGTQSATGREDGTATTDVSIKVVELLGGILPGEDGQELDAQEVTDLVSRNRDGANPAEVPAQLDVPANASDDPRRHADDPLPYNATRLIKTKFETEEAAGDDLENRQVRVVKVGKSDSLVKILQQAGGDAWQAKAMAETAKGLIPDGVLTAGQEVRITMVPSLTQAGRNEPARFSVFTEGHDHKVTVTRNSAGDFVASATPFDDQPRVQTSETESSQLSSLYASFYAAGLMQNVPAETIQQMLRVHANQTDFRRRVRGNDTIEMFFDLRDDSSPESAPGELLFTGISGSGITGKFWRFRTPDGVVDFYDEQGSNAKKFLMRKPIRSDQVRLTDTFGMRFHPLFNERRMHYGIDWAGPIGTPVVAAGNGVVEEALYKGGNGKYVRIRHANGYQTAYLHLSGFARGMEPGVKVRQGQVIGFLGNTGYSTGPHLHFEILVNNQFVNPLSIQVPNERQLNGKMMAEFQKERGRIDELMRRPPVMTQTK